MRYLLLVRLHIFKRELVFDLLLIFLAVAHGLGQDQKNLSYDEERLVFVVS